MKLTSIKSAFISVLILCVLFRVAIAFYDGDIVDAPSLLTDQRSYHRLDAGMIK